MVGQGADAGGGHCALQPGLDLIGQARLFYTYAGEIEGKGRDEDALAYLRDEHAYANLLLVEQPNGDFAATMVRQLLYAAFMHPYFQTMQQSTDTRLAAIAAKAVKEMAYHVRHAAEWVIRLGDGTEESHVRAQAALDDLWMYTGEMFEIFRWRARARAMASPPIAPPSSRHGIPPSIASSPKQP